MPSCAGFCIKCDSAGPMHHFAWKISANGIYWQQCMPSSAAMVTKLFILSFQPHSTSEMLVLFLKRKQVSKLDDISLQILCAFIVCLIWYQDLPLYLITRECAKPLISCFTVKYIFCSKSWFCLSLCSLMWALLNFGKRNEVDSSSHSVDQGDELLFRH